MDIHRSRFVPYPTSAISALAFSRSSDSGFTGPLPALKLAVGRANGDVEIWNPQKGSWVQENIFVGDGRSIDGLAWTQDPNETDAEGQTILGQQRLFSIASSPAVTEWDLALGQPKRKSTGNFSEVWCFAAQPRSRPQKDSEDQAQSQEIVAGCGDGVLVLLSTADNDLQFKRFLARISGKRARCMCITYQSRDRVVAGFADGTIRIHDTRNGSLLRSMSLGVATPGAPKNALVWQVKSLPNGDIVSGDSNGELKIWDGKNSSMTQRISGHEADCLDLITSNDGRTIISGSIDGKIAIYKQTATDHGRKTWARISHRRLHNGEVKAMAAFDSKGMSVMVSGGSDVAPMVTPLREYGRENVRALPCLPQDPVVISAPRARLLVSWRERSIQIWRIAKQSNDDTDVEPRKPRKLVAQISLSTKQNIQSVAVSPDGRALAASTNEEVKVFQLRKRADSDSLAVRKLHVPDDLATSGARLLNFSPNGQWLVAITPDGEVQIIRIAEDLAKPKHLEVLSKVVELDRRHRNLLQSSAFKAYDRTVTRLAFSPDSSVLVASDLSGYLDSWVLEGHEDLTAPAVDVSKHDSKNDPSDAGSDSSSDSDSSDDDDALVVFYGQHWSDNLAGHLLPKLDSAPLVLTFRPKHYPTSNGVALTNGNPGVHATRHNPHAHSHELPHGQHRLWIMTARHQMYEFDILAGKLSDWSRKNPSALLPEDFTRIRDRVMSAVWDSREHRERLWLYGSSFVFMLDVGTDLDQDRSAQDVRKRRRKPKDGSAFAEDDQHKRRKLESGAGGHVDAAHKQGMHDNVKKVENGVSTEVDISRRVENTQDDDEEDDDEVGLQLTRVRSSGDEQDLVRRGDAGTRKWWCTYKYRPILGVVPLEDESSTDRDGPLEVVIVERPPLDGHSGNS